MSEVAGAEDAVFVIARNSDQDSKGSMSKNDLQNGRMSDAHAEKLSPNATKARSMPSTPSQRPESPPLRRASPNASRTIREGSPHSMRTGASRTPPAYRPGAPCKYETGMKSARRRMPYSLGTEPLPADPVAASKKPSPKEEFRLTKDMKQLYQDLLPTSDTNERRSALVSKLTRLLKERWPGRSITVDVFGSSGNLLGTKHSDVDICISTDCKEIEHVCSIADLLARNGMERIVCVSRAKVPIVKAWDPELQLACDLNVNNPIALENTELIRSYVAIDDRFRPLAMIVKHWAKKRVLNDAALGGTLSSYTWICLVLNFLQTRKSPILPSLQTAAKEEHFLKGVNVAFDKDLRKYVDYGKENISSLGDLLFQFFHYYGHELDFERSVMSVRLGKVIEKSKKAWHLVQDNRLCVEEPFNVGRNLGNTADDTSVKGIHQELRRACSLAASGDLEKCCEQFEPVQTSVPARLVGRDNQFVPPPTNAKIIPQPPPQPQPIPLRPGRNPYTKNKRGPGSSRNDSSIRRASNPPNRPNTHLRDLPFQMTPQELQLQQQHQQHLLHDQLFQQYQYLQMQEQELRLQLYRHRVVAAGGLPPSALSNSDILGEGQSSSASTRTSIGARTPLTAPLYQSRFNATPSLMSSGLSSSGIVTNPGSPLLATAIPDSRRFARRASINNAAAATLRTQSQPARGLPPSSSLPYLTQRFDVPVRQVDPHLSRRSSTASLSQDAASNLLQQRLLSQNMRYGPGRPPVEYVGYYVGQSPSLSAYTGSATISPVPSHAGLAIHNGGLSPRLSTRSSRLPSVSTSPSSHYVPLANGTKHMTSVTENEPFPEGGTHEDDQQSMRSGPLVVDGSVNSPPRRLISTRPARSSSDEFDNSVTTSEDVGLNTPPSSDELSANGSTRPPFTNGMNLPTHDTAFMQEKDYLSLNNATKTFNLNSQETAEMMQRNLNIQQLTQCLAAHTVNGGITSSARPLPTSTYGLSNGLPNGPLLPVANGIPSGANSAPLLSQEWQTPKVKKNKKKKSEKPEAQDKALNSNGADALPEDERLRKGG